MAADIRLARASDVDALVAIENTAFQTDRLSRRSFRHLIDSPSAAALVAEAGGRIAGYCIVLFRAGASAARLYSISAASDMAGQGVGRALIVAAERAALDRGKRALRLEVREDNSRAVKIYRRAGFRPVGRKSDYYQDGMAALRMEKPLIADEAAPSASGGQQATFAAGASFPGKIERTSRRAPT
jgi:ribosomal protein S18 acetylase RimI-like enzyme